MKKLLFIILIFITVISANAQSSRFLEVTGEVQIKHASSNNYINAQVGNEIFKDTIISTGFRSTAIISAGSTTILVRPLTRLSLAEISSTTEVETLNVNLQAGRIRVDVSAPAGTRKDAVFNTPSAVASVRGTEFEISTVSIEVMEGSVRFAGLDNLATIVNAPFSSELSFTGESIIQFEVFSNNLVPLTPVGFGTSGEKVGPSPVSNTGDFSFKLEF